MKKLVSLILALAMVLSMGLVSAQAEEPTKIIWWVYGSEAPSIPSSSITSATRR